MTEPEANEAFGELSAEIDDFLACLSSEIGFEARLVAAQHPGLNGQDARGRPLLMPRLVLLATLCEHPAARTLPSRVLADDWRERYLAIDAVTPNGTAARLPEHADSTNRLIQITFGALTARLPTGNEK
jgi:hypothetical protein